MNQHDQGPEAFSDFENKLMEKAFCRAGLRGETRNDRDSGPIGQDDQIFGGADAKNHQHITVTFSRSRYRPASGNHVPVDDSPGLGYLTIPTAYRALLVIVRRETRRNSSESWEARRQATCSVYGEQTLEGQGEAGLIRKAKPVPVEAVAVSLDGVMIAMQPNGREEACWCEASCGTTSFQDVEGNRLEILCFAWMPEAGKTMLKAQTMEEVAHIRKMRPDLQLVADAAVDN